MKFIALFHMKSGVTQAKLAEAIARRSEYKFPEGLQLLAEYWTPTEPSVISVFEAADPAALMLNSAAWIDVFDVKVLPIVDWQEGAKKLSSVLGRK